MKGDRYVVREIPIKLRTGGTLKDVRKIMIGFFVEEENIVYPHPLTDFIDTEYFNYSNSLSHQKLPAYTVVQFLNYIHSTIDLNDDLKELKDKGVFGLTLKHGSMFLNHISEEKEITKDTFSMKVNHMKRFYSYLNKNHLLEQKLDLPSKKKGNTKDFLPSFKGVKFPLDNPDKKLRKKKDIITSANKNRIQMIREFLLTAYLTEPSIALAMAFQSYGGLRSGECVNLLRSSVKPQGKGLYGEKGFILEVRDNQEQLFQRLKNTIDSEVKKPRDQAILNDSIVSWLYKQHLVWLDKLEKQNLIKNRKALFINGDNGEALSGRSFRYKFEKVKEAYLQTLQKTTGRLQDFVDLSETDWSTHIGRGTFTNLVISSGFSVEQTAIARGDSNINSALHYTDVMTTMNNINSALEVLSSSEFNATDIDISPLKKTWKEVVHFGKVR